MIFALVLGLTGLSPSACAEPTITGAPINSTQRVKNILTLEQRGARKDFIRKYRASPPEMQKQLKQQVKADPGLRMRLGLKPILENQAIDQKK